VLQTLPLFFRSPVIRSRCCYGGRSVIPSKDFLNLYFFLWIDFSPFSTGPPHRKYYWPRFVLSLDVCQGIGFPGRSTLLSPSSAGLLFRCHGFSLVAPSSHTLFDVFFLYWLQSLRGQPRVVSLLSFPTGSPLLHKPPNAVALEPASRSGPFR